MAVCIQTCVTAFCLIKQHCICFYWLDWVTAAEAVHEQQRVSDKEGRKDKISQDISVRRGRKREKTSGWCNNRVMCGGMEDGRKRAQTGLKNAICPLRSFSQNTKHPVKYSISRFTTPYKLNNAKVSPLSTHLLYYSWHHRGNTWQMYVKSSINSIATQSLVSLAVFFPQNQTEWRRGNWPLISGVFLKIIILYFTAYKQRQKAVSWLMQSWNMELKCVFLRFYFAGCFFFFLEKVNSKHVPESTAHLRI